MTIDMKSRAPSAASLPRFERPRRSLRDRLTPWKRYLKRALAALAIVGLFLYLYGQIVTPMVFSQRQEHLSASLQTPKPILVAADAMGVIQIPALGVNAVVVEGATVDNLRGGPVRMRGSALPGEAGVSVVLGHRSSYGSVFERLTVLEPRDEVIFQARGGPIVQYLVAEVVRHTHLADIEIEQGQSSTLSTLLLVTGEAGLMSDEETIVIARALPVTDAQPVVPRLVDPIDGAGPVGLDGILGLTAAVGGFATWAYLKRRVSMMLVVIVVAPLALFATMRLMLAFDAVLPLLR